MLKLAKVIPLEKRLPHTPQNLRPVSQLSIFSKFIEKAALKQLVDYFNKEFSDNSQFGFRKFHQCEQAALLARHEIEKQLNRNRFV